MAETLNYNINVGGNASDSVGSLKKQLREAQAEVGALSDKFGATSKEAVTAAKRAAELKDRIGDAKSLTDAFNPDAKFKALSSSLAGVAGGFAAVQGAIGLFGSESKELEKQLLKVQSALALSQGLQSIGESVDSFKQLGAVIKNQVVTSFSTLRGAIIATGVGALAVGIGLLIANFDKVKKVVLNLVPGLGAVADFIGNLINKVTDFIGVTSEAGRATAKLIEDNDKAIKDSERNLELNGDKYDEYTTRKLKANQGYKEKQNEFLKDETLSEAERNKLILQAREKANREIVKSDADREANKNKVAKQGNDKAIELSKQQKAEQKKLDEEEEQRKKARDERESTAQKLQIDAFRATLSEREQATLQAEDELEEKKATLIKAGNFNFELIEEEHRLKLAGVNDKYNKEDEDKRIELENKKKEVDSINRARELETRELNATTLEENKNIELEKLSTEYNDKLLLAIANGENILALEELFAAKKLAISKKYNNNEAALNDERKKSQLQLYDAIGAGFSNLSALFAQGTAASKAAAIADLAIGTGIGFIQALDIAQKGAKATGPAAPFAFPIFYASQIASVLGAASKAKNIFSTVKGPQAGGISAPSNNAAPISPQSTQTLSTRIDQQSINAFGNQALRAYVVETDISTSQQRIQAIKQRARFG